MGLKIFERILGKSGRVETQEVTTAQLCQLAQECRARELAFQCCVNLIAGALGRCEFRTYLEGRETFVRELLDLQHGPQHQREFHRVPAQAGPPALCGERRRW